MRWLPPHPVSDQPPERRITFLELFHDLIYVAVISQLSHGLATHMDRAGIARFMLLFVIIWWAWFNGAMYHDLHGNNDLRSRIFTFLQVFAVAGMAVFAGDALGQGAIGFAIAYTAFHLILTWLWWRTGVITQHAALSRPFAMTFLATSLLFLASVVAPPAWRVLLWGLAVGIDLALTIITMSRTEALRRAFGDRVRVISPSAVERFGLLAMIVLGEVVVSAVNGLAGRASWTAAPAASLGMMVAIGLWWLYFDVVAGRTPLAQPLASLAWAYLHLPVTMGIAAVGASVLYTVEHAGAALTSGLTPLLAVSIGTVLISVALIARVSSSGGACQPSCGARFLSGWLRLFAMRAYPTATCWRRPACRSSCWITPVPASRYRTTLPCGKGLRP